MDNSTQPDILAAALMLVNAGYTPIPLSGKMPVMKDWTNIHDVTPDMVRGWHNKGMLQNVGLVCGERGKHLVAIDFDGFAGYDAYAEKFPDLVDTRTVLTGSGKGKHCYYIVEHLPASKKASRVEIAGQTVNIEICSTGRQIVTPPSLHPDTGNPYTVINKATAKRLDNLDNVVEWVESFKQKPDIPNDAPHGDSSPKGKREQAYTLAAYNAELDRLRAAGKGERNETLNKVAFSVFSMAMGAWDGLPSGTTIESDLLSIALQIGLEKAEAVATIASGRKSAVVKHFPDLPDREVPPTAQNGSNRPLGAEKGQSIPPPPEPARVLRYGKAVAERYHRRLLGELTYEGNPVQIPMQALWQFGGFAKRVPPGKAIGLIAPSGGGKTTMCETWIDLWLQRGLDPIIWSPEWTEDELMDRRVQRMGGLPADIMQDYAVYCADRAMGIPPEKCGGRLLTPEGIAYTETVLSNLEKWRGEMVVYQDPEAKLEDMFVILEGEINQRRKDKRRPDVWVIDYASLLNTHERLYGNIIQERVLKAISFCRRMHITLFLTQQVTKEASRGAKDGKVIGAEAAHWLRPDFFSLFLALEPEYVGEEDMMTGDGKLRVVKNNDGRLGAIDIRNDFDRKVWEVVMQKRERG